MAFSFGSWNRFPLEEEPWGAFCPQASLLAAADGERGVHGEPGMEHPETGWEGFEASLWFGGG